MILALAHGSARLEKTSLSIALVIPNSTVQQQQKKGKEIQSNTRSLTPTQQPSTF